MLCPHCGADVGDSISLCDSCEKRQESAHGIQQESEIDERTDPGGNGRGQNADQLRELYKQSLGVTRTEEFVQMISRPLPLTLIGIVGFLVIFASLSFTFPDRPWYTTLLFSVSVAGGLAYAACYITVLMDLFYIDRIAFMICFVGFISVPYIAFLYKDEVGWRKLFIAAAGYTISVVFAMLALVSDAGPGGSGGWSSFGGSSVTTYYSDGTYQRTDW